MECSWEHGPVLENCRCMFFKVDSTDGCVVSSVSVA